MRWSACASDASHTCRALQQQFQEKEAVADASPCLSVNALTAAMTKREAAKIFYQICGTVTSLSNESPAYSIARLPGLEAVYQTA